MDYKVTPLKDFVICSRDLLSNFHKQVTSVSLLFVICCISFSIVLWWILMSPPIMFYAIRNNF